MGGDSIKGTGKKCNSAKKVVKFVLYSPKGLLFLRLKESTLCTQTSLDFTNSKQDKNLTFKILQDLFYDYTARRIGKTIQGNTLPRCLFTRSYRFQHWSQRIQSSSKYASIKLVTHRTTYWIFAFSHRFGSKIGEQNGENQGNSRSRENVVTN